jgi:hypothetical protein
MNFARLTPPCESSPSCDAAPSTGSQLPSPRAHGYARHPTSVGIAPLRPRRARSQPTHRASRGTTSHRTTSSTDTAEPPQRIRPPRLRRPGQSRFRSPTAAVAGSRDTSEAAARVNGRTAEADHAAVMWPRSARVVAWASEIGAVWGFSCLMPHASCLMSRVMRGDMGRMRCLDADAARVREMPAEPSAGSEDAQADQRGRGAGEVVSMPP